MSFKKDISDKVMKEIIRYLKGYEDIYPETVDTKIDEAIKKLKEVIE
jgi:hypothetical protein